MKEISKIGGEVIAPQFDEFIRTIVVHGPLEKRTHDPIEGTVIGCSKVKITRLLGSILPTDVGQ